MNEDLSNILEQALQYAVPLPVPETVGTMETGSPEPEKCFRSGFIIEGTDGAKLHELCNISANNNAEWTNSLTPVPDSSGAPIPHSSGTVIPDNFGTIISDSSGAIIPDSSDTTREDSESPQAAIMFSEHTFRDDYHSNEPNNIFHTLECAEEVIEFPSKVSSSEDLDIRDKEFAHIEIHVTSDDSNLTQLQPVATLTEILPDSSSGLIDDIRDITDAYLRFENGSSGIYTPSVESTLNYETDVVKPEIKRRRRREKNPGPPPEPIIPPCSICEEKSSGYHYGANTCEACKGFYRRTMKKKEVDYKCRCTLEERDAWKRGPFKNGCPACRYERCLAVGMSKNAIKIGRYTLNHKTKNIKAVKSMEAVDSLITALTQTTSEGSQSSTSGLDDVNSNSSTVDLSNLSEGSPSTSEESSSVTRLKTSTPQLRNKHTISLKEIDSLVKILTDAHTSLQIDDRAKIPTETIRKRQDEYLEKYKLQRELFGTMRQLTKDEFTEFYNATGIDIDGRIEQVDSAFKFLEEKITMIVAFAKAIPGFTKLGLDDQANLIKASRVETNTICTYKSIQQNYDGKRKVITFPWGMNLHQDELGKVFPRELMMAQFDMTRQLFELNLSTQEESILRAILVLFSDRCTLDEPGKVDAIQEKLMMCLQHLINLRSGGAGSTLYKIFSVMTNLRNVTDMSLGFQKRLLVDWPMFFVSNHQLLQEFFA